MKDPTESPPDPQLHAALLQYAKTPGKYQLTLRQPAILFRSIREILQLAAGRGGEPGADNRELREAAGFFLHAALLYPGADHYAVLGLPTRGEPVELKERYRLLMRLIHPDYAAAAVAPWPPDAAVRVNRAYEVLSSPVLRREYDEQLAGLRAQATAETAAPRPRRSATARPQDPFPNRWTASRKSAITALAAITALLALALLMPASAPEQLVQKPPRVLAAAAPAPQAAQPELPPVEPTPAAPAAPEPVTAPSSDADPAAAPAAGPETSRPAAAEVARPAVAVAPVAPVDPPPAAPAQAAPRPLPAPQTEPPPTRRPEMPALAPRVHAVAPTPLPPAPMPIPVPEARRAPATSPVPAAVPIPAPASVLPPTPAVTLAMPNAATSGPAPAQAPAEAARITTAAAYPVSPTLAEAQPLLTQLLQMLETGSGEQLLRLLDADARSHPSAQAFSRHYERLVRGGRPVRLSHVDFRGEPRDGVLLVTGRIRLHAGEPTIDSHGERIVVRAEFASRGGRVMLTGLEGGAD